MCVSQWIVDHALRNSPFVSDMDRIAILTYVRGCLHRHAVSDIDSVVR